MMRRLAAAAATLIVALTGCASTAAAPGLDEVIDERSRTATDQWLRVAAEADAYLRREWPDAVHPTLAFDRWVAPERYASEVLQCMSLATGRTVGSVVRNNLVLAPRPAKEPTWALPVAHVRCTVQLSPWSDSAAFGGPVEHAWVTHQVTVALPACVRRWGGELVIDDLEAAIDASIYPTTGGLSSAPAGALAAEPLQSVWRVAELRNVDDATAQQIRATCPDPGRALSQLEPPAIRP
ncbi:MAG: hypothetical protein KIT89_05100 [Microcella sp.]|uniref:hypothetical protein n=1 Tax=Microcella sp. TaxID=1913979 RepID=UPI0024C54E84|nr:hypothetical protein [Microcella sp.]UYN84558.1 MAG: hypothetical protein KIT89_05100 [Microcella sp.]